MTAEFVFKQNVAFKIRNIISDHQWRGIDYVKSFQNSIDYNCYDRENNRFILPEPLFRQMMKDRLDKYIRNVNVFIKGVTRTYVSNNETTSLLIFMEKEELKFKSKEHLRQVLTDIRNAI